MQQRLSIMVVFASVLLMECSIRCVASTSSPSSENTAVSSKSFNSSSDSNIIHKSPFILPGFSGTSSSDDSDEGNDSLPSEEASEEEEEDDDNVERNENEYDEANDSEYQQKSNVETKEGTNVSTHEKEDENVKGSEGDAATSSSISSSISSMDLSMNVSHQVPLKKSSSENQSLLSSSSSENDASSSKPLRTLKKLQAMLEDTDYATATTSSSSNQQVSAMKHHIPPSRDVISQEAFHRNVQEPVREKEEEEQEDEDVNRLWTSKDRSKYKYQQRKLQRERQRYLEQQNQQQSLQSQQQQLQQHVTSDDDSTTAEITDGTEDTDDGLGYTLPNLPIYMSDGESTETDDIEVDDGSIPHQKTSIPPLAPPTHRTFQQYPQIEPRFPPEQQGQGPPYRYHYQNNNMQTSYPSPQQQMQQPYQYSQGSFNPYQYPPPNQYMYNDPNSYNNINVPPPRYGMPPPQQQYGQWTQTYPVPQYQHQNQYMEMSRTTFSPQPQLSTPQTNVEKTQNVSPGNMKVLDTMDHADRNPVETGKNVSGNIELPRGITYKEPQINPRSVSLRDSEDSITFDSLQKLAFFTSGILVMSYAAVSPRTLDRLHYNLQFRKNVSRLLMTFLPSVGYLLAVVEREQNSLNSLIGTFYASATLGFSSAFILEIIVTTLIRLAVFLIWEPSVFSLTPDVPLIILPWTLRENNYRPKRITLLVADLTATCLAAPVIEEYVKLKVVQFVTKLPRNFIQKKKNKHDSTIGKKKNKKGKKKYVLQALPRQHGEVEVTNINSYVSHFMAASLGMKFCDTTRRVLVYNRRSNVNKNFYAMFRGFYPIQDLCGVMTALELAKRDVLGLDIPTWKLIFPAAFVHAVANLKGKKPIFKFNSSAPWTELGLWIPGSIPKDAPLSSLLPVVLKTGGWFFIILRVFGYCVKNYYMVQRNAVKRVTTFAGKNASFSAELEAAAVLKRSKKG